MLTPETPTVPRLPRSRPGFLRAGAVLVVVVLGLIPLLRPKPPAAGAGGDVSASDALTARPSQAGKKTRPQPVSAPSAADLLVAVAEVPGSGSAGESTAGSEAVPLDPPAETADERHRRSVLGQWTQYDHGPRLLTVNEDGTGTMVVEPDGAWAYVIGAKVTMDVEWSIEKGRVLFKSVRGTPETSFKAITQLFGSERNREILELTDKKLVLLDTKDGSKSEWTRVE